MAFDAQGRLYIATGDNGEIYRVDKSGQGASSLSQMKRTARTGV